jgi:TRAP-type mannitol/chloroaromatic compound transport system permease small subunit
MTALDSFCRGVSAANERVGSAVSWLALPLTLLVGYDVGMRYAFGQPTVWAWDIIVQIAGAMVVLAGGFTLKQGGHIGVDILVVGLSPRRRAIVDALLGPIFLFTVGAMTWVTALDAWDSTRSGERLSTVFAPPIYPFRIVVAIGALLLLLQGVVKLIRDLTTALAVGSADDTQEVTR